VLTYPIVGLVGHQVPTMFPVIGVSAFTAVLVVGVAALAGLAAAALPALRAVRLPIVNGLRTVG